MDYVRLRRGVAWRNLGRWLADLDSRGELLRLRHQVDCNQEAACIADELVKTGGPAVLFERPRLADGSVSEFPLAMNLFGTRRRTLRAMGVSDPTEIGRLLVGLMKPDIGAIAKRPWKGLPLARQALSLAPRKVKRPACQQNRLERVDLTRLPITTSWPADGGPFITLGAVVTRKPGSKEHNLGLYRAQLFDEQRLGLHWQLHKHGADHADQASDAGRQRIPVAICLGGPPELIFSAIAPLPDNLEEYMFAGLLAGKRLRLAEAVSQPLLVPAEAEIVIEGYCELGLLRTEGPFGDHFGYYSLEGEYPVLNVTAITHRTDAIMPATIVGLPPMEDGYLGEAITDAFTPVLRFQHRDVRALHLPLETGFHNLAILAAEQRYPRQARKTALGLFGAGQMMFLKSMLLCDANHPVKDFEALLDLLNDKVDPSTDLIILRGMVADALEQAAPWENVHDKLLIDATSLPALDPRSGGSDLPTGTGSASAPAWRRGEAAVPGVGADLVDAVRTLSSVVEARHLRPSILVVTTHIEGGPTPRQGLEAASKSGGSESDAEKLLEQVRLSRAQRTKINQLKNQIWQLDTEKNLRWLFITDDDLDLQTEGARRALLWQLFTRFDVGRDLTWDEMRVRHHGDEGLRGGRVCWDATAPIPHPGRDALQAAGIDTVAEDPLHPIRRWPAMTLHDPGIQTKVLRLLESEGY